MIPPLAELNNEDKVALLYTHFPVMSDKDRSTEKTIPQAMVCLLVLVSANLKREKIRKKEIKLRML